MASPCIVLALDFAAAAEAMSLVARLSPDQCRLKVGLELYTATGPSFVRELTARGFDVFLDLKFHDIPTTVARACERAADLGVWMLTVHAAGGRAMMTEARAAVLGRERRPLLVGVTVLTSLGAHDLAAIGIGGDVNEQVLRLAHLARDAGLDGVVCAPTEAALLRHRIGPEFKLVTPGVRPAGVSVDDQQRALTPVAAIGAGADFLVIGRPITRAPDPVMTLAAIRRSIGE